MKRRYHAPARVETAPDVFVHPLFSELSDWLDWCLRPEWPSLDDLNAGLAGAIHGDSGQPLRFVAQTAELLSDGCHYESRIHERGEIATRRENWHDLLNAMIWCRYPSLKAALNTRQHRDVLRVGPKQRTPAQCAQTLFDEGGAILQLRDAALLEAWDRHDWQQLFDPGRWRAGVVRVLIFGHALLEHALTPGRRITAKCLVWCCEDDGFNLESACADAVADGIVLNDPPSLRPLPLHGIPGWHAGQDAAFYVDADYFRGPRPGRRYPPACGASFAGRHDELIQSPPSR